MKLKNSLMAATLIAASCLAANSHAIEINNYMLNFSAAGGASPGAPAIADLTNVDEWKITAFSIVAFNDVGPGSPGTIGKDDTFDDYIVVRIDQFQDNASSNITPVGYGSGGAGTHEITMIIAANGHQLTGTTYLIDGLSQYDIQFDAGTGYTSAVQGTHSTFTDGIVVETGAFRKGGGVNTGPTDPTGTTDLTVVLTDILNTLAGANSETFELDENGNAFPPAWEILLKADTNNDPLSVVFTDAIGAEFASTYGGLGLAYNAGTDTFSKGGADYDFFFYVKSDGSINKAVPEPATLALMGLGLLGFGMARRRNMKV